MSAQATSAVFLYSKSRLASRLVLLAIADRAHEDGAGCYESILTIANKAAVSERAAYRAIAHLETLGELAVDRGEGINGTNAYRILLPGVGTAKLSPPAKQGDRLSPNPNTSFRSNSGDKPSGDKLSRQRRLKEWEKQGCQSDSTFCDRKNKFCSRCDYERRRIMEGEAA